MPRTSRLAIAAFVLAVLGPFTLGVTIVPAIVLGFISTVIINKSGGRLAGSALSAAVIVISFILLLLGGILMPALLNARQTALREACARNLSLIGKAMHIYAKDYDGQFPRSGGKKPVWGGHIPDWKAQNRFNAYGLAADGRGGTGSIGSCFYLLVKDANVMPQSFICSGDTGATMFKPVRESAGDRALTDLWDFGSEPSKHCSYSYHQPFNIYSLSTSSNPGMAVAADRNPWIESPAHAPKTYPGLYNPDGGRKAVTAGNARQHQEDGQNVLFLDNHVGFEKNPFCGINDDNIYTYWDGGDIRKGGVPILGASESKDRLDSFLVHDGRDAASGMSSKLPTE